MPAKKAKKPSRSFRYLLFADRRLQKISLRKISERVKKAKPAARSRRSTSSARGGKSLVPPLTMSPPAVVLGVGVIGILAAAALITARQPSEPGESGTNPTSISAPLEATTPVDPAPAVSRAEPKKTAPRPVTERSVAKASSVNSFVPRTPAAKPVNEPAPRTPAASLVTPALPAASPVTIPRAEPAANAEVEDSVVQTTITGCLVSDDDTYRLKNTSGVDAPKSRSWKSGFLRKRSAAITLVDPSPSLHLTDHVGERVAVTGTLTDRDLRPRSVRRVAGSCD